MRKDAAKTLAFGLSLSCLAFASLSAQASAPVYSEVRSQPAIIAQGAAQPKAFAVFAAATPVGQEGLKMASFNSGCSDPSPWWTFSGIEALTCLFSGQWT